MNDLWIKLKKDWANDRFVHEANFDGKNTLNRNTKKETDKNSWHFRRG